MHDTKNKVVVTVPDGNYCWDYKSSTICTHFDNCGGPATCNLGFYDPEAKLLLRDTKDGVLKAPECTKLKSEVKK